MQGMESRVIGVATIHDIDGARFRHQHVEGMDIVQLAVGYVNKAWNAAPQVEQRVHFTAALVVRKCAHGKTDRHRSMVVESSA